MAWSCFAGDNFGVHHDDHPGGGLSCVARCCLGCTHSLRWPRVVVAKPNHRFFRCQHPSSPQRRRLRRGSDTSKRRSRSLIRDTNADWKAQALEQVRESTCFKCSCRCTRDDARECKSVVGAQLQHASRWNSRVYVACTRTHRRRHDWRDNDRIARKCADIPSPRRDPETQNAGQCPALPITSPRIARR